MPYSIEAIISSQHVLESHAAAFASAAVVPMVSGLALIPITDELIEEAGAGASLGQFYKFTPAMADWLCTISRSAPAAYIEAEFWGGEGEQNATVWAEGEEFLAPTHHTGAINLALKNLGFGRGTSFDEFEAFGLGRHRDTKAWLADAIPEDRNAQA